MNAPFRTPPAWLQHSNAEDDITTLYAETLECEIDETVTAHFEIEWQEDERLSAGGHGNYSARTAWTPVATLLGVTIAGDTGTFYRDRAWCLKVFRARDIIQLETMMEANQ